MPAAFARMYDGTIAEALEGTDTIRSGLSAIRRFMFCASVAGSNTEREDRDLGPLLLEPGLDALRPGGTERILLRADDDSDLLPFQCALLATRSQSTGDGDCRDRYECRERDPTQ